jgi:hypothetical protein
MDVHIPKLARGVRLTRRCELALREFQPARQSELAKRYENHSCLATLAMTGGGEIERPSGEVEADKLAGPAHALFSEEVGAVAAVAQQ